MANIMDGIREALGIGQGAPTGGYGSVVFPQDSVMDKYGFMEGDDSFGVPGAGGGGGTGAMGDPSMWDRLFGYTDGDKMQHGGIAGPAISALSALGSGYLGMKQYGLAKDSLKEGKRQFDLNFGAQQKMTNSRLRDRQRARVASNPNAYQSVDSYMDQNRI